MIRTFLALSAILGLAACLSLTNAAEKDSEVESLSLEDLYPEKSLFGPSARSPKFSSDGRYAAYLYRPYVERRHGNDLWVYDFQKGETIRITNIKMMSQFQRSSRIVIDDRVKHHQSKAKKKTEGQEAEEAEKEDEAGDQKSEKEEQEDEDVDDSVFLTVDEEDADDEYRPAYSGVSSFSWHPKKNEILLSSEGDVYRLGDITKPKLDRLTKTDERESQVRFTPDGSGYTLRRDDAVLQTIFGDHRVQQLTPKLPSGERLSEYTLSHDGKRIAIASRTGNRSSAREVDIIRYRDRFAKSDKVSRTVSDDTVESQTVRIYLFEFDTDDTEEAPLLKIFEESIDEPRDILSTPKWSLDDQQLTFCFFDQKDSDVQIRLSEWPSDETLAEKLTEAKKARAKEFREEMNEAKKKDVEDATPGQRRPRGGRTEKPELVEHPAKTVYRFKHYGGPNTPRMVSPDFAGDNQHIVFVSEQSGFRHIHMLDPLYESVRQLTSGRFEVYPVRFSDDHKKLFVTSTKDSAARRMVYTLDLDDGNLQRLNEQQGTYSSVAISNDGQRMMANYVRYGQLTELIAQNEKKAIDQLTDSHPEKTKELTKVKPEFLAYENRHGHEISAMMFKPKGWKENGKKHPLLIYVYGGPLGERHSVNDGSYSSDAYFFQMYMAQKHNYMTLVVDPRGQSGYGGLFEKSNYEQVGKPQVEDLVDGVKYMKEEFKIDDKRVAIYGWSFGGFQTQMCLYTEPDVFQVGMAGAGPTQWENYNSWYTTGTVGPSRKGKPDQEAYSLIPLAKKLKGQLLLVHGMEDTNVLFQDTVAVYRALLKAGKETNVELFLDPTGGHGLGGDVKRLNRMRKYEEFLLRTIGKGPK